MSASNRGDKDIVELLLQAGADKNAKNIVSPIYMRYTYT